MVLVFSLPFCLLLPDGDYPVKLDDDVYNLNLTKVIPKVFDERLPFRGFMKGELDNISRLSVMFRNGGKIIDIGDLSKIKDVGTVTKYFDKQGKEIVPCLIPNDVNLQESDMIVDGFKKMAEKNCDIPAYFIDQLSQREHYMGRNILINGEVKHDRQGRFRYTKVKFTTQKKLHYEEQFKVALMAINTLIDVYRQETSEHWITNVTEDEIFYYKSVNELATSMSSHIKGFTQIKQDHDHKLVTEIKNQLIVPNTIRFPYFMLILDAKKSFDEKKYYLAIVYAVTALESIVKTCITIHVKSRKLGDSVEKELGNMGLYLLVTTIIKIFVTSEDYTKELIYKAVEAIRLRNRIIHKTELDVTQEQAKTTIQNIQTMARVLMADLSQYGNLTSL